MGLIWQELFIASALHSFLLYLHCWKVWAKHTVSDICWNLQRGYCTASKIQTRPMFLTPLFSYQYCHTAWTYHATLPEHTIPYCLNIRTSLFPINECLVPPYCLLYNKFYNKLVSTDLKKPGSCSMFFFVTDRCEKYNLKQTPSSWNVWNTRLHIKVIHMHIWVSARKMQSFLLTQMAILCTLSGE